MSETFKPGRGPAAGGDREHGFKSSGSGRSKTRQAVSTQSGTQDGFASEILLALVVGAIIYFAFFSGGSGGGSSSSGSNDGNSGKTKKKKKRPPEPYTSLEAVEDAIRKQGLESCNLIVGVDFTRSNTWNGKKTFQGRSLHDTSRPGVENPYQRVMRIVASTLASFDEDNIIPCFGFGDIFTQGKECFPFYPDRGCNGLDEVLVRYNEFAGQVQMSGPTNFAPVIRKAMSIVKETGQFHVLVIIADGQVDKRKETIDAIVEAARYPLSIVCIGVGDGPWDTMEEFDDDIPQRAFDNFQFVDFTSIDLDETCATEPTVAMMALMELPAQYAEIRRLNLL